MRALVGLPLVLFATSVTSTVTSAASARPTEVIVSAGILSPTPSPYRSAAETLGYDRRAFRHVYEGEAALLHSVTWWLAVGPVARFYYGDLSSPYEPVPAIKTYSGAVGVRGEVELFPWPRLFLWAEPLLGVGAVGDRTLAFWGVRGGVGIGTARGNTGVRLRLGYSEAPTFANVTASTGAFNYGGFMFMLDGVFRVAR